MFWFYQKQTNEQKKTHIQLSFMTTDYTFPAPAICLKNMWNQSHWELNV